MLRSSATLVVLLLLSNPLLLLPLCSSFNPLPFFSNYQTLFSLSHSLFSRVANLRESRGDFTGADRARSIARELDNVSIWKVMWNVGWDYVTNFSWPDAPAEMFSDLNQIVSALTEFSKVTSDKERAEWMKRNYENLFRVSESVFGRFRKVFRQSGPLKVVIERLQKEVVDGDLLKDCLELGATDLKGLLMVFKDISSKFTSTSSTRAEL